MNRTAALFAIFPFLLVPAGHCLADEPTSAPGEPVVLLHGLARSAKSMSRIAESLEAAGYRVCKVAYPSREHTIATLAADFVAPAIAKCFPDRKEPVHFVTHSLGGIIARQLAASGAVANVGRVVMLSPPNQGSEVVDKLGDWVLFEKLNGPAGRELGTEAAALPRQLGPAPFELGIITGKRTVNPILSALIPGEDDGKVSLSSAKLCGMKDYLVVAASHPFIMNNAEAIAETLHFLQHGEFLRKASLTDNGAIDCAISAQPRIP